MAIARLPCSWRPIHFPLRTCMWSCQPHLSHQGYLFWPITTWWHSKEALDQPTKSSKMSIWSKIWTCLSHRMAACIYFRSRHLANWVSRSTVKSQRTVCCHRWLLATATLIQRSLMATLRPTSRLTTQTWSVFALHTSLRNRLLQKSSVSKLKATRL